MRCGSAALGQRKGECDVSSCSFASHHHDFPALVLAAANNTRVLLSAAFELAFGADFAVAGAKEGA
jgi:hypothetical protein